MASASPCYYYSLIIITQLLVICVAQEKICPFEYVYQLGDSISDTGNLIRIGPFGAFAAARLPYGETFFHRPTGRWSDGLLIIDFFAVALQLPLLNPYLDRNASFDHGANFAVAGSTALDTSFLAARGIQPLVIDISLSTQLKWFKTLLTSTCPSPAECGLKLRRALIFMGEIGGDDFNYAFSQGKSIQELQDLVPDVVGAIINAVREVIRLGAIRIVVPGNFPVGCFPFALTALPSADPGAYDDLGCLRNLNNFAVFQNNYPQGALASLRQEFPQAVILYADYYSSFESVLRRAPNLGFDAQILLKSCCGIGGSYNFDINRLCGSQGVPLCCNPNRYIFWGRFTFDT